MYNMSYAYDEDEPSFSYEDEPDLQDGVRNLSVSSDGTIDSIVSQGEFVRSLCHVSRLDRQECIVLTIVTHTDETPTPPQSPNPRVQVTPPSHYPGFDSLGRQDYEDLHATPVKQQSPILFFQPPSPSAELPPPIVEISPTTRPTFARKTTSETSLAARRAASGKLPNKALLSLQQMRFETPHASTGLGVGPGSAGFEGMEGVSPGLQSSSGAALRLALGLGVVEKAGKDSSRPSTPDGNGDEENSSAHRSTLGSPSILHSPSRSRRGAPLLRSPGANTVTDPLLSNDVKIPPSLRGSKLLDKLNLAPPIMTSPLSPTRERPNSYAAPPSPLMRTSAYSYSMQGPLTPLTPSHVPGAPSLAGGSSFDWFAYSMPDSPGCPLPPSGKAPMANANDFFSSKQAFFLPTPSPSNDRPASPSSGRFNHQRLPASPLGTGRFASGKTNPFFTP